MEYTQFLLLLSLCSMSLAKTVHYIHWNRNNPMFRIDNTDHIIDVNKNNLPWEYDQVNIICPVSKPGTLYPEKHVIYSVTKEEYESCRITNPKPQIVAICNNPHRVMYFTHTFRSFTPTPGGMEFLPGKDYYFISTSSREDLHRRVGGGCSTHNMRLIFKVFDNSKNVQIDEELNDIEEMIEEETPKAPKVELTTEPPRARNEYIYYYHPRDLIDMENSISTKKISRDYDNELWRKEALRYTAQSSSDRKSISLILMGLSFIFLLARR